LVQSEIDAQFRPSNDSNYRILEIDPSASDDDVKKAAEEKFKAMSSSAADVVGHVGRDDHGDFH